MACLQYFMRYDKIILKLLPQELQMEYKPSAFIQYVTQQIERF